MIKRIAEWIALTKTERTVIRFLVVALLAGAGIRFYQSVVPASQLFDYRASDSTFAALSTQPESKPAAVNEEIDEVSGKLNINTATKQQLIDLPGIGEVTAERIIKLREESGNFSNVDELRAVKGMSRKKIERLRPLITTE